MNSHNVLPRRGIFHIMKAVVANPDRSVCFELGEVAGRLIGHAFSRQGSGGHLKRQSGIWGHAELISSPAK